MRIQLWKAQGATEDSADYVVRQRQRLNDGTTAYVTVDVGWGFKREAPSGETYIDITLKGFGTNNKPNP